MLMPKDTEKIINVGGFSYNIYICHHLLKPLGLVTTNILMDNMLIDDFTIESDKVEKELKDRLSQIEKILKEYTPSDRLMFFLQDGVAHSLGVTYKKKPGSIKISMTYYYDYQEMQYDMFVYHPENYEKCMTDLKNKVMSKLELFRINYIRDPEKYYEIYNVNGFGFEIGLAFSRSDTGDYEVIHILDEYTIGKSTINTSLIYGIEKIMDNIKSQICPMCPTDVEQVFTVGDDIDVKVNIKFIKEASKHPVKITASLDNMLYTVNTVIEFNYYDPDRMLEAKKNILDDIKGFLDTFPKSCKDLCEVRDCKYLISREVKKEAGSNIFKMQMKLDNEKYGDPMEFIYNINSIDNVKVDMVNEVKKLYNKLKSDTPNDIISEYNKNDMDFTIHAHFYKKPGDSDIKIEYRIENHKK